MSMCLLGYFPFLVKCSGHYRNYIFDAVHDNFFFFHGGAIGVSRQLPEGLKEFIYGVYDMA